MKGTARPSARPQLTPSISITRATNGAEPATPATFTVTLSETNNTGSAITVTYQFGGTATGGADYDNTTNMVTIPAGSSTATITVLVNDDTALEGDETIEVMLISVADTGITIDPNQNTGTATITDDEFDSKVGDSLALVAIYNATNGPNWITNTNWLQSGQNVATWHGVTVTEGRVTELDLRNNQLEGPIPALIENLTELTDLYLSFNQLTGNIPMELGNLTELTRLDLRVNQLTGNIPMELGNLTELTRLDLWSNQLTGNIPMELGNLTELTRLDLSFNQLTGNIPIELGNLTELTRLDLDRNQLTGNIPMELENLTELTFLDLSVNQLTGNIPMELGGLTRLRELYLWSNQLDGPIPALMGNLTELTILGLGDNQLTGNIPMELGNLTELTDLSLAGNRLTGNIPMELGGLTRLRELRLSFNQLAGPIPASWATLTNLGIFHILGNQFDDIPDMSALNFLDFDISNNNFEFGDIIPNVTAGRYSPQNPFGPEQQLNPIAGANVDLSISTEDDGNNVYQWFKDGVAIPSANATSYTVSADDGIYFVEVTNPNAPALTLQSSDIAVMVALNQSDSLALVAIYNATNGPGWRNNTNWLQSGQNADTWHGVTVTEGRVTGLRLSANQLDGPIPALIGNLTELTRLVLSDNRLTGNIPMELGNLTELTDLSLSFNQLTGNIPMELGNLTELTILSLSDNQLTGNIPMELGNLTALTFLYLRNNQLAGPIPASWATFTNLDIFDISGNQFDDIPDMSALNFDRFDFNISNNNFEFGDIIPNVTAGRYSPQNPFGPEQQLNPAAGANVDLSISTEDDGNNAYQWFKDGVAIPSANATSYTVPADEGIYFVQVTNPNAPALTLQSSDIAVMVALNQSDSLALVAIYNATNGPGWRNNTNWLQSGQNADTWHGVTVTGGRVTELDLRDNQLEGPIPALIGNLTELTILDLGDNQLTGNIPMELGNLTELTALDLRNNQLTGNIPMELGGLTQLTGLGLSSNQLDGPIPASWATLTNLFIFYISENQFDDIPDMSALNSVVYDFDIRNNNFEFGDIIPNVTAGRYSPQNPFGPEQQLNPAAGADIDLSISTEDDGNNAYQWFKDGVAIPSANATSYTIPSYTVPADDGIYFVQVTHPNAPALTLQSSDIAVMGVSESLNQSDSLALVALFNATDGFNWDNKDNWLAGPVSDWSGITVASNRVTGISLPDNNLEGGVPVEINDMAELAVVDLSGNDLHTVPAMNLSGTVTSLNLSGNLLDFNSLIPNQAVPGVVLAPQQELLKLTSILAEVDESQTPDRTIPGTNNVYSWLKDSVAFPAGGASGTFTLENIRFESEGSYVAQVTNPELENVTLRTKPFLVRVSSIRRDSLALVAVFESAKGANWVKSTNWLTGPLATWSGITVENNRVTGISLPDNNLQDTLAIDLQDIGALVSVDLSQNELRGIPDMTGLKHLMSLDVSGNRLGFEDLEINVAQAQFEFLFTPQRRYGVTTTELVRVNERAVVSIDISGTRNTYQWYKKPRRTIEGFATPEETPGTAIEGGTARGLVIDSIKFETMGIFYVEVSNPLLPGLIIRNRNQNVFAVTDVSGTAGIDPDVGSVLTEGDLIVYEIEAPGRPFTALDTVTFDANGAYFLDGLIPGDYILKARPGKSFMDSVLQTYYGKTGDWVFADTLQLRTSTTGINIDMIFIPPPFDPEVNDALIVGSIESDLPDSVVDSEAGLRVRARRRVRRAGVSLNKLVTRRRQLQQEIALVAYTETDDEGRFGFPNVPPGDYLLNVQFPGIPMDTTTLIEFKIDPLMEEQFFNVAALVTELGISLELIEETGFYRKYFKDLTIYPNPAKDYVTIDYEKLNSENIGVYLTDLTGHQLLTAKIENGRYRKIDFDTSKLPEGIYMLVFVDMAEASLPVASYKVIIDR